MFMLQYRNLFIRCLNYKENKCKQEFRKGSVVIVRRFPFPILKSEHIIGEGVGTV